MWMIVGLGNPGEKYAFTRHNVGFMALDAYTMSVGSPRWREEIKAAVCRLKIEKPATSPASGPSTGSPDTEVILVKPQTYMNLSGEAVRPLLEYYKIPISQMIVLHDDIDQGFGALRIHKNRGAGGHNGLKSLNEHLGTQDYVRIKMGVGRPVIPQMDVASYVLQNFNSDEQKHLHDFLSLGCDAFEALIFHGYDKAASKFTRSAIAF